jgi:hypothetical protein
MGLASIPVIGPPLAIAIAELELRHLSGRLEALANELRDAIERVDRTKVDHAFLATPAFTDIVIAGLDAARRTSDRDKLRLLASIVAGATTDERPQGLDVEGLIVAIRDLPPSALQLAWAMQLAGEATPYSILERYQVPPDWPDGDFMMGRLIAAGLARGFQSEGMTFQPGGYQLTGTWTRLMKLAKEGGWRPSV